MTKDTRGVTFAFFLQWFRGTRANDPLSLGGHMLPFVLFNIIIAIYICNGMVSYAAPEKALKVRLSMAYIV